MIKIVFYGTGDFAAAVLRQIAVDGQFEILGVITQPDRPVGRRQETQKTSVKITAEKLGLAIMAPATLKDFDAPILTEADLGVVAEYGLIIPRRLLDLPKHKTVNLHGSILPFYRGASPIQTAILNGESKTGVTLMLMDEKMDHGPILAVTETPIRPDETQKELFARLADVAAKLFIDQAPRYVAGELRPIEQNHALATYCKILTRADGQINFSRSAQEIYNQYRALTPWPGIWTTFDGRRLKLTKIALTGNAELTSGKIKVNDGRIFIGSGINTAIEILALQMEGKKNLPAQEFIKGTRDFDGATVI
ncbi:MAG: methionyl-tRNA formyltransferase [Patescibacteria group bacterium]|nr:methionyl-tRNA formyltransferase [Patescibacteria group bacterium]